MCGIAGIFDPRGVDVGALCSMSSAIAHRGPDGEGFLLYADGGDVRVAIRDELDGAARAGPASVGLAHRRLAIIDLSDENEQPALSPDRGLALVYNGEIYNYIELREELERLGHAFRTSGDTEVLLTAYAEWGPACVERLVGMWAFAILDRGRRVLFCSRDRFGIKPLYYLRDRGAFHFASEIKGILAVPGVDPDPDPVALRRYLLTGAVDESDRTFFEGIRSLPAAHNLTVPLDGSGRSLMERYWSLPHEDYRGSRSDAAAEFAERFRDSVRLHSRSDVPVGTCLSGGLDSSAIVCVAEGLRAEDAIPSYTHRGFGYLPESEEHSERRYMEEVVRHTSLEMTYVRPPADRYASALEAIVAQQDEPFGSASILAQWFVFESARKAGMKVMLDGQGADEVLAGYHYFFPGVALALLRSRKPVRFARYSMVHRRHRGEFPLSRAVVRAELRPSEGPAPHPEPPPWAALLSGTVRGELEPADWVTPHFGSADELFTAHTTSLGLPSLLRFEDRNSMGHSIEARVPFLDHRLVEFAFRLPAEFKLDGATTKRVLRDAMRGVLPEAVRARGDKIGFRAEPTATWNLADRYTDSLVSPGTDLEAAWFDEMALGDLFSSSDRSDQAEAVLWRVINAKLWARALWADDHAPLSQQG